MREDPEDYPTIFYIHTLKGPGPNGEQVGVGTTTFNYPTPKNEHGKRTTASSRLRTAEEHWRS